MSTRTNPRATGLWLTLALLAVVLLFFSVQAAVIFAIAAFIAYGGRDEDWLRRLLGEKSAAAIKHAALWPDQLALDDDVYSPALPKLFGGVLPVRWREALIAALQILDGPVADLDKEVRLDSDQVRALVLAGQFPDVADLVVSLFDTYPDARVMPTTSLTGARSATLRDRANHTVRPTVLQWSRHQDCCVSGYVLHEIVVG